MEQDLIQIEFYFPPKKTFKDRHDLAEKIVDLMREKGSTAYSGYVDEAHLLRGVADRIGNADIKTYTPLSHEQTQKVKKEIAETIRQCNEALPLPTKNFIFVFPYLPTQQDSVFEGVMGTAPYSCVFHLFISPENWSEKALKDTVAHELNHTIFYYQHYDDLNNYTLLDNMVLEGLAENFRETVASKIPAPWSIALKRGDAIKTLESMMRKEILFSRDPVLINKVLFGEDEYDRWAGYSIGYWLVKDFLKTKTYKSWEELMKLPSKKILNTVLENETGAGT